MENKTFFSVIMPVYGVEKYLSQAIDSILSQTFPSFELILVDDRSPDNCPAICDEYQKKDPRVKVIHKPENQGVGMARNTGMESATGEYIFFVDSDDTVHEDALKIIHNHLKSDTEIFAFGVKRVHENQNGKVTRTEEFRPEAVEGNTVNDSGKIFLELTKAHLFIFLWNKVYKRSFLAENEALFERTKVSEDFLFNIFLFSRAEKVAVIPDCLYYYRKPAHQTLTSAYCPEFYDLAKRKFRLEAEFLEITENNSFESRQTILFSHVKHIISAFLKNTSRAAGLSAREQKQRIRDILNDETTEAALAEYAPKNPVFRFLKLILKKKMIHICYLLVAVMSKIKGR